MVEASEEIINLIELPLQDPAERRAPPEIELEVLEAVQRAHTTGEACDVAERRASAEVELEVLQPRQRAQAAAEVRDVAEQRAP